MSGGAPAFLCAARSAVKRFLARCADSFRVERAAGPLSEAARLGCSGATRQPGLRCAQEGCAARKIVSCLSGLLTSMSEIPKGSMLPGIAEASRAKGPKTSQPRATPWVVHTTKVQALKGRNNSPAPSGLGSFDR